MHRIPSIIIIILLAFGFFPRLAHSQSLDELRKKKNDIEAALLPLKAESDKMQAELNAINSAITEFPGWYTGAFGTMGASITGRNKWFAAGDLKDSRTAILQGSLNAFANKLGKSYFWRNAVSINVGWQRLKTTPEEEAPFQPVADNLSLSSLYGHSLSKKIALSGLVEYRSSVIRNWNNPGYIDVGAGITFRPASDIVVVVHPANYNFIIASDTLNFTSSLGCKLTGDISRQVWKGLHWRSNVTGFLSYRRSTPSLHNGTWTNWFSMKLGRGLGVGIECALRYSEQEQSALQFYYTAGVSYSL